METSTVTESPQRAPSSDVEFQSALKYIRSLGGKIPNAFTARNVVEI